MNVQSSLPRQNRVTPTGDIISHPARGHLMGNRGCLHDEHGRLRQARWKTKAWIACRLDFHGRSRRIMSPGSYTELFFLDEATALAAGHRPCFECRREAAMAFRAAWHKAVGEVSRMTDIDRTLHAARVWPRTRRQRRISADIRDLPVGSFILHDGVPHLVRSGCILPWTPDGYGTPAARPRIPVTVLTPAPMLKTLAAGYKPEILATFA